MIWAVTLGRVTDENDVGNIDEWEWSTWCHLLPRGVGSWKTMELFTKIKLAWFGPGRTKCYEWLCMWRTVPGQLRTESRMMGLKRPPYDDIPCWGAWLSKLLSGRSSWLQAGLLARHRSGFSNGFPRDYTPHRGAPLQGEGSTTHGIGSNANSLHFTYHWRVLPW